MIKPPKPRRKTVELSPSRIRRDPPLERTQKAVRPYPTEREIWAVVVGVILFAIAITALTFGISDITSH